MCLYHWWSIKAKEKHLQIKDEVMETFFWNTVMEPHCKNIIKKWRFTEHVANTTLHKSNQCTVRFFLYQVSLLTAHALHFVCSFSDLFPSFISKEQMGVLHIHPLLPSIKMNSKYLWPVHSPTLQYCPCTSVYSIFHTHILLSLPTHSYFQNQMIFRISKHPTQRLTSSNSTCISVPLIFLPPFTCKGPWSSVFVLPFRRFKNSKSSPEIQNQFLVSFFSDLFITIDISDHILLKISTFFSLLTVLVSA